MKNHVKKKKSIDPVLIVSGIFKMAIVTVRRGCLNCSHSFPYVLTQAVFICCLINA